MTAGVEPEPENPHNDTPHETYDTKVLGAFTKKESAIECAEMESEDFYGEELCTISLENIGALWCVEKTDPDIPVGCGDCMRFWVERQRINYQ